MQKKEMKEGERKRESQKEVNRDGKKWKKKQEEKAKKKYISTKQRREDKKKQVMRA